MSNRHFSRATVLGSCIVAILASAAAAAQEQPAKPKTAAEEQAAQAQATELSEVVVTGTRLRRTVYDSPSPIMVVTRDDTLLAGFNSTTQALQGTGVTGGSAQINNAFGGFVTNGGPGANTVGLRGLGPGRTLVLLNGRRVAPAGSRGSVGSADLNVLPSAMLERVEILRDGASSIYGSDAIAGVINIITRRNLDGVTIEAQHNGTTDGGGEQTRFSVVGGMSGERFSVAGSVEYYKREDLALGDREWARCNQDYRFNADGSRRDFIDPLTGTYKCYPITGTGSNGVTINTLGTSSVAGVGAAGSVGTSFNRWRPNSGITTGLVGYEGVGGGSNNLNVRDTFESRMLKKSMISPAEIITTYLEGRYELQALGNAELYGEFLANRRDSSQVGYRQLSLDYPKGSPLIPANLAFSTFLPPTVLTGTSNVGVRAFIGFGNDENSQRVDFYKGTVGLKGDMFLDDWRYDFAVSYSKSDAEYTFQSWLTDRLAETLNAVTAPTGTPAALVRNGLTCAINITDPTRNCIVAPVVSSAVIGGILPQDWIDYTWKDVTGSTKYDETVVTFNTDGPLFNMPAGAANAAFGLEYRKAKIDDTPNYNSQINNLYNLTSSAITRGTDSVWEAYGELELPLLRDMSFAKDLSLNLSARYTEYDSYGDDTTYKLGLSYTPVDWLSLRGTYGTSYRAPALFEQFQGGTSGFLNQSSDPCNNWDASGNIGSIRSNNCASEGLPAGFNATSSIRVITAGGAAQGLEAETSDNLTFGVILQPSLPDGFGTFALAVDYYDIQINNGVSRVGASNILSRCYDDPEFRTGGGYCRFIDPRAAGSYALTVYDSYTNIATQVVEGIDYNARYTRDIGPGALRVNVMFTQYLSQKDRLFKEDSFDEVNGTLTSPEYTGELDMQYSWDRYRVRYGMEWIAGQDSHEYLGLAEGISSGYDFKVPSYMLHNLSVQYTSPEDWSTTIGVRNLTNESPPWISQGAYNRVGNGPLYSGYDYVGRQIFVNLSKSF